MNPIAMTLLLGITLAVFAWSAGRRLRQLGMASPESNFEFSSGQWIRRLGDVIWYALLQRNMQKNYPDAGMAHMLVFWGFLVLLLRSLMLWARGYDPTFDFWGILGAGTLLGDGYALMKDLFILAVLLGASMFVYLRVVKKTQRMTLSTEGLIILLIIIVMMIGDILYDGATIARNAHLLGASVSFHAWEPVGSVAALALSPIESDCTLATLGHIGFWVHSALVLIFLNILPFTKHFHIITALPNVFTRDLTAPGALPLVDDLEGRFEREEPIGISKLPDLTWKHVLDLYTCTECGRCSDNCPAYNTGKKLSPKHVTLALRDHLYETETTMFNKVEGIVDFVGRREQPEGKQEIHGVPRPPADAYFRCDKPIEIAKNVIDPAVLWGCTTCRACEEQCPVEISYVDKIVGFRRDLVMMQSEFPPELQKPFNGMETNGNPWNISAMDRADWANGLDVPLMSDNSDVDVLLWVGCAAAYDDRSKKVARATVKLLKQAGIRFAILGTEETCTGDSARRAGNEYLFQMLAEKNVETLNKYNVSEKTILTTCPHCFNTLKNEYPQFGGHYRVEHHADFLLALVNQGKLKPQKQLNRKIAYHDSCYLGRYNDIYDSPRKLLERIPGVSITEPEYWTKSQGMCCGAGGAQMWMEEQTEDRVCNKRTNQMLATGCSDIATACPFCMTMLTDGLKAEEKDEDIAQLDIAELLALSTADDQ